MTRDAGDISARLPIRIACLGHKFAGRCMQLGRSDHVAKTFSRNALDMCRLLADRGSRRLALAFLLCTFSDFQPAIAAETVTYTYDALGRLTNAARAGSVNNGVSQATSYDAADNRTNVTVTGVCTPGTSNRYAITAGTTSWTVPPGVYCVTVYALGMGGNGQSGNSLGTGRGGGGGGFAKLNAFATVPGSIIPVQVPTTAGAPTWWFNATTLLANGASGGTGGAAGVGDVTHAGGSGGIASGAGGAGGGGAAGPDGPGQRGGNASSTGSAGGGGADGLASTQGVDNTGPDGSAGGAGPSGNAGGAGATGGSAERRQPWLGRRRWS